MTYALSERCSTPELRVNVALLLGIEPRTFWLTINRSTPELKKQITEGALANWATKKLPLWTGLEPVTSLLAVCTGLEPVISAVTVQRPLHLDRQTILFERYSHVCMAFRKLSPVQYKTVGFNHSIHLSTTEANSVINISLRIMVSLLPHPLCRKWDSNSQPSAWKADALTLGAIPAYVD